MLVRVRRLIFEMLERRSMLAADAESLDGFDALGTVGSDAGEAVGGDPTAAFVAFLGEERIEPEIAGCWLEPPEAWCVVPPTAVGCPELPEVALVEPVVEAVVEVGELVPSGDTVADVAEPAADQVEANGVSESVIESDDEAVAETGGDADTAAPLWEGVSLEVIRSTQDDLPTVVNDSDSASDEPRIVICTGFIDWMESTADDWRDLSTFSVACSTADGSGPTVVLSEPSESGDTEVVDATVFEPEAMRGSPVAVSARATVTAGSADVARLFAAYAAGLGQSAADHMVAATIGGRRGTRR